MKKTILLFLFFLPITLLAQKESFFLNASFGYTMSTSFYNGFANGMSVGYKPIKYAGIKLSVNSVYLYSNEGIHRFSEAYTNTGLAIGVITYPIRFKGHGINLGAGYSRNFEYHTWAITDDDPCYNGAASSGRNFSFSPYWEAGYSYDFKKITLGIQYEQMRIKKYTGGFTNKQYLLSLTKNF